VRLAKSVAGLAVLADGLGEAVLVLVVLYLVPFDLHRVTLFASDQLVHAFGAVVRQVALVDCCFAALVGAGFACHLALRPYVVLDLLQ